MTHLLAGLAFFLLLFAPTVSATAPPPDLRGISYDQRPGNILPADATFRDEHGNTVRLADLMRGKPLILDLGYFHCPALCGIVRGDLLRALSKSDLVGARDYALVSLSIDPAETPQDAATAKRADVARFPAAGAEQGWHFLTGAAPTIKTIADAVGFRERFDARLHQFLHPTGIVFITSTGVISNYLLGVGYRTNDVELAITRAQQGSIASAALPILLLCYDYDASTGRYTLAVMKLLRLAGAITVLTVGVTLWLAFRRDRSPA